MFVAEDNLRDTTLAAFATPSRVGQSQRNVVGAGSRLAGPKAELSPTAPTAVSRFISLDSGSASSRLPLMAEKLLPSWRFVSFIETGDFLAVLPPAKSEGPVTVEMSEQGP